MNESLLYEEIYQKTQDCGRAQFVKLLQQNQIKIEQLQQENAQLKQKYEIQKDSNNLLCKAITCDDCDCSICKAHKENIRLQQENKELKEKLEENTKIYLHTSKYASEMESKYIESNYILTEIEKWLEEQKENDLNENFIVVRLVDIKNKLQELKGVVNNEFMDKKSK